MKLEDIKKMSDEEFIEFVSGMKDGLGQKQLKTVKQINKLFSTAISNLGGLITGYIWYDILNACTDDKLIQFTVGVLGFNVGVSITEKVCRYADLEAEKSIKQEDLNKYIEIKKSIENLTEEEFLILKGANNSNVRQVQKQMKMTFDKKTYNKFIDSLEPSYKDDEENLGYSKNIGKNN